MHLNETHAITFGELDGGTSERVEAIADAMAGANFDAVISDNILLRMWEKWVFLATLAAGTCLMRGSSLLRRSLMPCSKTWHSWCELPLRLTPKEWFWRSRGRAPFPKRLFCRPRAPLH